MKKNTIEVNYRILRDEGETIVITPINDEIRIKKPNPKENYRGFQISGELEEKNLRYTAPPKRLTYGD